MLPTRQLRGTTSTLAYLVLLRVEIARFTRTESARLCCSDPHLRVLRLVGGEVLPPTLSCAVRTFLQHTLSGLVPAAVWRASRAGLSRNRATKLRGGPDSSAVQP